MQNDLIETMSKEARRIYCSHMNRYLKLTKGITSNYGCSVMPHYDGTSTERPKFGKAIVHRSGKDFKPVWPRIAKSAIDNDILILELIRSQFESSTDGAPSANSCHGPRAVRLAISRRDSCVQESANLLNSFKKIIDTSLTLSFDSLKTKQAISDVILLCKVPSLCKVNIMMFMQLEDYIQDNIMLDAIEEYLLAPDVYEKSWAGAIHSKFESQANKQLKIRRAALGIITDKLLM